MSNRGIKLKSFLLMFLIVTSIFSVSFLISPTPVHAATPNSACCERTLEGDSCIFTDKNSCNPDLKAVSASCEQTSYCALGSCFIQEEGRCFKNTPKTSCEQRKGLYFRAPECQIPEAQVGCCILNNEAFFTTLAKCKLTTSKFPDVKTIFDVNIKTEQQCIDKSRSQEKGACVKQDGQCTFTTREQCNTAKQEKTNQTGLLVTNLTSVEPKVGFHKDFLCSNTLLGTTCAKQQKTGCFKEDVYWFDSCGNAENIYNSDKEKSFNKGFVLSEGSSCSGGVDSRTCGNCDYKSGTLCGKAPKNVKVDFGNFVCRSVDCSSVRKVANSPNSGGKKKVGESWCLYDKEVGLGRDAVGSRHFRSLCINGEEIPEPCRDFREEICISGVLGKNPFELGEAFSVKGRNNYVEARCRDNRWEGCFQVKEEDDCNNNAFGDCFWLASSVRSEEVKKDVELIPGVCVPQVPSGSKFWPDIDLQQKDQSAATRADQSKNVPGGEIQNICKAANLKCEVTFKTGGISRIFGTKAPLSAKDECISNCECLDKDWALSANNLCVALGDCGANINFRGEFTKGGFDIKDIGDSKFLDYEIDDDFKGINKDVIPKGTKKFEEPGFFDEITDANIMIPLLGFIGISYFGGVGAFNPGIFAALKASFITGLSFPYSVIKSPFQGGSNPFTETGKIWAKESWIYGNAPIEAGASLTAGSTIPANTKVLVDPSKTGLGNNPFTTKGIPYKITGIKGKASFSIDHNYFTKHKEFLKSLNNKDITKYEKLLQDKFSGFHDLSWEEHLPSHTITVDSSQYTKLAEKNLLPTPDKISLKSGTTYVAETTDKVTVNKFAKEGGVKAAEDIPAQATTGTKALNVINSILFWYTIYTLTDTFLTEYDTEEITSECKAWQAPLGGSDCRKCGEDNKVCSQYRCRALGQTCRLVNEGTDKAECIDQNPNDANSPIIKADKGVLTKGFTLKEKTKEGNKGYEIKEEIQPFKRIQIGILTDEPAQCKVNTNHSIKYQDMPNNYFGTSLFTINHTLQFNLPNELATDKALKLTDGGFHTLYTRCIDGVGNANNRDYFVRFKIKKGPDLTPPVVERTSLENGAFVPFGNNETDLSIFVNEPSECKYSKTDSDFETMTDEFSCVDSGFEQGAFFGLYQCDTKLKGFDEGDNTFFIRCKDQPGAAEKERNVNEESFRFNLVSTGILRILDSGPTGTLFDVPELKVTTQGGAQSGQALCAFSEDDIGFEAMTQFFESDSTIHKQSLIIDKGDYNFFVKCRDKAANEASTTISFKLDVDLSGPRIITLYKDTTSSLLHIEVDEESICEYSTTGSFSFGEGTLMTGDKQVHEATLIDARYHLICKDNRDNQLSFVIVP